MKNEVLHRVREYRDIVNTLKRRKTNWIGHVLFRNCLLTHVAEGKIEGTKRRRRIRKHPLDVLNGEECRWRRKMVSTAVFIIVIVLFIIVDLECFKCDASKVN